MTVRSTLVPSEVLSAPFKIPARVERLGRALWLYLWLVLRANRTGHVCRMQVSLAQDLHVSNEDIRTWLERLVETGLVDVSTPAPYLVIKLLFWSGKRSKSEESSSSRTRAQAPGSSKQHQAAADDDQRQASSSGEKGGAGEGEGLLGSALAVLGTTDEAPVRDLIARFQETTVRQALRRVQVTPRDQIRKSRLALFRYLLVKLSDEPHDDHPTHSA